MKVYYSITKQKSHCTNNVLSQSSEYLMMHQMNTIFSTAESIQLCYTNWYGVVVVVGVVVIVGMVNFFSFDVSIWFLPLVRIVSIKEHLNITDSYWRLQFRCWWWKKQIILLYDEKKV